MAQAITESESQLAHTIQGVRSEVVASECRLRGEIGELKAEIGGVWAPAFAIAKHLDLNVEG